jgi:hypothetical protein
MIHQAKSNPQLLDEQIFSERLASANSAIGTFQTWPAWLGGTRLEMTDRPLLSGRSSLFWILRTARLRNDRIF